MRKLSNYDQGQELRRLPFFRGGKDRYSANHRFTALPKIGRDEPDGMFHAGNEAFFNASLISAESPLLNRR
jgi:hypothetical protein